MKATKSLLAVALIFSIFQVSVAQKEKYLKKADALYQKNLFSKAKKTLTKYKSSLAKLPVPNNYLPGYYVREARISVSEGVLEGFEKSIQNAVEASKGAFGENSVSHAKTLTDIAAIYNDYGNFRLSREYMSQAKKAMEASGQTSELDNAHMALVEAEAMIGQGFYNEAIELLKSLENYFAGRAVEKETYTEGNAIKTRRLTEEDIFERFNDYAKLLTLKSYAYGKKGRISLIGEGQETADGATNALESWLKGKTRFLGPNSIGDIQYRYLYARIYQENRGKLGISDYKFDRILLDLKKRFSLPINTLGHEVYQAYLEELLKEESHARYITTKKEYEKLVNKYFPKQSLHRINIEAVEFNSKLSKDKTRYLEGQALNILNSKSLPKFYKTTEKILLFLVDIATIEKRYGNAENYLNQLIELRKELYGEQSTQYHLAKLKRANFLLDYTNKLEEAGKIYEESYNQMVVKQIDVQHTDILDILNHMATWYELTDKYSLASSTLKNASDVASVKYTRDDILYGVELTNIARLHIKLGEYDLAEADIKKSLEIIDMKDNRNYYEYPSAYINALQTQAKLYAIQGLFDDAQNNLDRTTKLITKNKVEASSELSTGEELSGLLIQLGRYSSADRILTELFAEYERLYGKNSLRLINPLVDQGRILLAKGDYTEAEKNALRANEIAVNVFGETSTKTAPTQKLLSDIYYTLGDYEKAESNILKTLASQEKQFGRNHIEVAKSLAQLALIKFHKGDAYQPTEKVMLEARDIMAAKLGKENPQYAEILKNVAVLYISDKRYDLAFNSLTVAESIWRAKTGNKTNINAAAIYTLTGDVYYQIKNYGKAEEFYNKAKDLYEKFFSTKHPEYVKILSKLSKVHYMRKDFKHSKRLIEEALANYENFIKLYFPALSEREKAKYWNTIKGDFEFYNTLAFSNLEDFRDLAGKVYNYQLLTKALLLSSSIKIRERIMNSTDEQLKGQFSTWLQKKELLTLALSMSPQQLTENEIDPAALQQEVERLEKELSQKSELFGQSFENQKVTYDVVTKSLEPNEVALEMVRYRYFDHVFTDSVIYAALYVKKDLSKPKPIILHDGQKMETRYFKYYRNAITGKIHDNVSYTIFWAPIQKEIGLASTIYLSADGVYNQINLEAIPTPDGKYVIDNANIILVSNTRDIYFNKNKTQKISPSENTASLFGNPEFYLTASAEPTITPLPGTEKEVNQLQFLLKQRGWATTQYLSQTASEENIKGINSPKIFHIATHGLYKPTEEITLEEEIQANEAVLTQNPLMRTGLLLKGAGDLLEKTKYNYNMDNGILTAYEAMNLNLDKTDLVVLSACETGLGEVEQGEGVFGLQRAFLVAGAKVLIMSMFKVDDEATQKLMLKFYQKWFSSGDLRTSFIEAKKEVRVEYPEPIYWGAFMMIGLD